jgi:hypothetical protein
MAAAQSLSRNMRRDCLPWFSSLVHFRLGPLFRAPGFRTGCVCSLFDHVGFSHIYQGWKGVLRTGLVGALLAYLYFFTGSLILPMVCHILIDARIVFFAPVLLKLDRAATSPQPEYPLPLQLPIPQQTSTPRARITGLRIFRAFFYFVIAVPVTVVAFLQPLTLLRMILYSGYGLVSSCHLACSSAVLSYSTGCGITYNDSHGYACCCGLLGQPWAGSCSGCF